MFIWRMILIVIAVICSLLVFYLWTRFHRFRFFLKLGRRFKILGWLASLLPVLMIGLFGLVNVYSIVIVILHLALFFALADLFGGIINRLRKKPSRKKSGFQRPYYAGVAAVLLCAIYLGVGWYNAHHVTATHYAFTTEKNLEKPLKLALIADSHLGVTLHGDSFARQLDGIQKEEPDILLIAGDFVDDDTPKEDMLQACEALGEFSAPYGIYFVFGNHDEGYYLYRKFTSGELRQALSDNGVTILEDESVLIDDRFYVIGRKDRSTPGRAEASSLTAPLDPDKYQIMLDHQPNDYAAETASGADLVLSGHTHGGHLLPAGQIGLLMHANDRIYGTEQRGDTRFVVTSGISGWAIPFKTGTFSEYVIIEVTGR